MEIDLPDVVAEVDRCVPALRTGAGDNDVATLNAMFRNDPRTIRYGGGENLYGHDEIAAFRAARSPVGLARTISRTVITTYGRDFAVASTLFHRADNARQGRPPDADLGALRRRLARGRRACQRDRGTQGVDIGDAVMTLVDRVRPVAIRNAEAGRSRRTLAEELRLQLADEIVRGLHCARRGAR